MNNFYTIVAISIVFASQVSSAATLSDPRPAVCANSPDCIINGVNLTNEVTSTVEGRVSHLKLFGAGLRTKKVLVVPIPVYVAQFYGSNLSKLVRTSEALLSSIDTQSTVAMTLTFRRDVEGDQIQSAFQDAFSANNVDMTLGQISSLLSAAQNGGVAKNNTTMTFVGERLPDNTTAITYENADHAPVTIHGDANFVRQTMSLWLGEAADSGLASAKTDILRDRNVSFSP